MELNLAVMAGATSTIMFGLGTLPMLRKAHQTKDLRSYSLGSIMLSNAGNVVHSLYVFSLPPGPIWLLHSFYLVTMGLMLAWHLRYEGKPRFASRHLAHGFVRGQSMTARVRSLCRASLGPPGPRPGAATNLVDAGAPR